MYFYAYGLFTFVMTVMMYVFFFLTYRYGYEKDHITFKLVGRTGAVLCTLVIFLYSIINFDEGINSTL